MNRDLGVKGRRNVTIGVEGERNGAVAEKFLNDLGMNCTPEEVGGRGVPQYLIEQDGEHLRADGEFSAGTPYRHFAW